ncbi:nitroreductase-like protein [Arsukibacterium ikkense]|uniref:Nitroreductase-like protein n=1 Tax=Arsukibacterium ikkense TaxID=336831 RepID=A0A0M2V7Y1_9GAMM|nr:nitroreductase family protein [Arsukibacterium ikkense]KKO46962.1 nitroreductase-like protein [Arsukibacterium ikkense]
MKRVVKTFFPRVLIRFVKATIARLKLLLMLVFSRNGFLASLYYALASRQFYREHRAVLLGSLAYHRALTYIANSSALLRRNIHRLEKGLIMRPRRDVFAEHYIAETVDCYLNAQQNPTFCQNELVWARDVLSEYFRVCGPSAMVSPAKARFTAAPVVTVALPSGKVPYAHHNVPDTNISYTELLQLFTRRRSVRWYQPRPVPMPLLIQAMQAAKLAPSACNRQPFQFYVANSPAKAVAVASCAMGTVGFAENLPCVVTLVGDLSCYPEERDRHVIYIDAALAAMQFMLALETLGLSSCPINWPDSEPNERQLSKVLALQYFQRPVMLIAVGYALAEGGIPYSEKKADAILFKDIS